MPNTVLQHVSQLRQPLGRLGGAAVDPRVIRAGGGHVLLSGRWRQQGPSSAIGHIDHTAHDPYALSTPVQLVEKGYFSGVKGAPALISYVAVATAGASNIVFSRKNELLSGATVTDADGNVLGNSVKAGRSVVMQTALSRGLFIPAPVLLLPPLLMAGIRRLRLMPTSPGLKLGVEVRGVHLPYHPFSLFVEGTVEAVLVTRYRSPPSCSAVGRNHRLPRRGSAGRPGHLPLPRQL